MKIILKKHREDSDMVEMYSCQTPRDYLMAVCHQDCFDGPICERLYNDETVSLDVEIALAEPSRLLDILAKEGFDNMSDEYQINAIEHVERCIADLAYAGWDYDVMTGGA